MVSSRNYQAQRDGQNCGLYISKYAERFINGLGYYDLNDMDEERIVSRHIIF